MRFCVAVLNGVVVGSRKAYYPLAVIHFGAKGPFASFHHNQAGVDKGLDTWKDTAKQKLTVTTIETTRFVHVGAKLPADVVLTRP